MSYAIITLPAETCRSDTEGGLRSSLTCGCREKGCRRNDTCLGLRDSEAFLLQSVSQEQRVPLHQLWDVL